MAKVYTFHIYSIEDTSEFKKIEEFEKSKIQIANEFEEETFNQLKKDFDRNDNVAIANKVEPPGDKGGGAFGIFPLLDWFHVGLTITIILTTKGFFDELGRGLAKKLLKVLFNKKRPTKLIIFYKNKKIEIIIPSETNLKDVANLENFLSDFNKIQGGKCVYSSETKTFVFIEKYDDFDDSEPKG
ncbi:MAG: hypothetical protein RBS77_00020 [Candidatus Moranbacteria bacterium]|jgi:hypothetical protein|nr:hypothetical protein [Candidatus Moranbacteria bacterium]